MVYWHSRFTPLRFEVGQMPDNSDRVPSTIGGSLAAGFFKSITYVIAKGQPRRIDQPAPACAAELGLE
jgi:hypothetical protein